MTSIEAKTKFAEVTTTLNNLSVDHVLSEFKYHKLLMDLKSIGVKSPDITELEMIVHFYGNNGLAVVHTAKRLAQESKYNLNYFHNITSMLTAFFEVNEIINYLENINLLEIDQNSPQSLIEEIASTAILFYFINGNLIHAKEKFGSFFSKNNLIKYENLLNIQKYEELSEDDFSLLKNIVKSIIDEEKIRIIAIDHSYFEEENLFDIITGTNIEKAIGLNDQLFEKAFKDDALKPLNALTYTFTPTIV